MPPQELNVTNSDQVSSPQVLEASLGTLQRQLLIFTGIAIPNWDSRGLLDRETVIVKLGRRVLQKPVDGQWSATVGLASMANTDSDFTFAADNVAVDVDKDMQLQLIVDIAVQGSTSVLSRFSYQANVLLQEKAVGLAEALVSDNIGVTPPLGAPPGPPVFQFGPRATVGSGLSADHSRWRLRIVLDGPAPSPGVFVHLASSNPAVAQVPQNDIPILTGHTVTEDFIAPDVVNNSRSPMDVTVTATRNSVSRSAVVTVLPVPA
jgi:hypothetical protein